MSGDAPPEHLYQITRILEPSLSGTGYVPGLSVTLDGQPLPPSHLEARPSPRGWSWTYQRSGPIKLGHAILTHELGSELADELYQPFAQEMLAGLLQETATAWTITSTQIRDWHTTRRLLSSALGNLPRDD